ncbi:hypothetical protein D3C71_1680880 [compost metagenome]
MTLSKLTRPCSVGSCGAALGATSARVLRISPSRAMEMPVCWKSVHSCAMRMMGRARRWANIVKATNWPTVSWLSMTRCAPHQSMAALASLPMRLMPSCAQTARFWVLKLAET